MFSPTATAILAGLVLAVAALALPVAIIIGWRRTYLTFPQYAMLLLARPLSHILWRGRVVRPLSISPKAGAILICNHRSPFDPFLLQVGTDRVVHWMVAREYLEYPAYSWFFKIVQSIPVGRGGVDIAATRLAIRRAQEGGLVGMFPEGRLNTTDSFLLPGRPGVALVALKAQMPVVPCYIEGAPQTPSILGALGRTAKAKIYFGEPLDLSPYYGRDNDRAVLEELTCKFLQAIADLAGHSDYTPSIAGRNWKTDVLESV